MDSPIPQYRRVPHDRERSELSWGVSPPRPNRSCPILGGAPSGLGWVFARRTALFLLALIFTAAHAQNTCSLRGIKHSAILAYPPIARQAHVTGYVQLMATFGTDGSVQSVQVASGNQMLRKTAIEWVTSWQVYESPQPQTCPITISFRFEAGEPSYTLRPSAVTLENLRHFIVTAYDIWTCDPSATITTIHHRFLFFHWHTKPVIHINE